MEEKKIKKNPLSMNTHNPPSQQNAFGVGGEGSYIMPSGIKKNSTDATLRKNTTAVESI